MKGLAAKVFTVQLVLTLAFPAAVSGAFFSDIETSTSNQIRAFFETLAPGCVPAQFVEAQRLTTTAATHIVAPSNGTLASAEFFTHLGASSFAGAIQLYKAGPNGTWLPDVRINNPEPAVNDYFGRDGLALEGSTLAVGVSFDDRNGTDTGSVFIYHKVGTAWTLNASLNASDSMVGDNFGASLALDGDTLAIGSPFSDRPTTTGSDNRGAVYVYTRTSSGWALAQRIEGIAPNSRLGSSVDLENGTLVVAAAAASAAGVNGAGILVAYSNATGPFVETQRFHVGDPTSSDALGTGNNLDLAGDRLIVGARTGVGKAYIFERAGGVWAQTARFAGIDAAGEFGVSVALDNNTAWVGAWNRAIGAATMVGGVTKFAFNGVAWVRGEPIVPSRPVSNQRLGSSVAGWNGTLLMSAYEGAFLFQSERDVDCDGLLRTSDNCPSVQNAEQHDYDLDTLGDACDLDVDGDLVSDLVDRCLYRAAPGNLDRDADGIGDECDPVAGTASVVLNFNGNAGPGSNITLRWSPPYTSGGLEPTGYRIRRNSIETDIPLSAVDVATTHPLASLPYVRQVNFTFANGANITVPLRIDTQSLIADGKMRGDCGDLRFGHLTTSESYPHWIESGCDTRNTTVWVRVSSTSLILMGYGDPALTTSSGPESVFYVYDEFDDGDWTDDWELVRGSAAEAVEADGRLTLSSPAGGATSVVLRTKTNVTLPPNAMIEARVNTTTTASGFLLLGLSANETTSAHTSGIRDGYDGRFRAAPLHYVTPRASDADTFIQTGPAPWLRDNTTYDLAFGRIGGNTRFLSNGSEFGAQFDWSRHPGGFPRVHIGASDTSTWALESVRARGHPGSQMNISQQRIGPERYAPATYSTINTGLSPNVTYTFQVAVITAAGVGPLTSPINIRTFDLPQAPRAPVGTAGDESGEVKLTWGPPAYDGGEHVTSYRIFRDSAQIAELPAGSLEITPADHVFAGWNSKRPITIAGTGTTLTDFVVNVTLNTLVPIGQNRMRGDCADVRFASSDGSTSYPFWLRGNCNTANTWFWVRVPTIDAAAGATFDLVYGNRTTTSASNGAATFLFFEDFQDAGFTDDWEIALGTTSEIFQSSGRLFLRGNQPTVGAVAVRTKSALDLPNDVKVEVNFRSSDFNQAFMTFLSATNDTNLGNQHSFDDGYEFISWGCGGGCHGLRRWINGGAADLALPAVSGGANFVNYDVVGTRQGTTLSSTFRGSPVASVVDSTYTTGFQRIHLGAWDGADHEVEFLFVRPSAATEPTVTLGAEAPLVTYTYVDTGLTTGVGYVYRVAAVSPVGQGPNATFLPNPTFPASLAVILAPPGEDAIPDVALATIRVALPEKREVKDA